MLEHMLYYTKRGNLVQSSLLLWVYLNFGARGFQKIEMHPPPACFSKVHCVIAHAGVTWLLAARFIPARFTQ